MLSISWKEIFLLVLIYLLFFGDLKALIQKIKQMFNIKIYDFIKKKSTTSYLFYKKILRN